MSAKLSEFSPLFYFGQPTRANDPVDVFIYGNIGEQFEEGNTLKDFRDKWCAIPKGQKVNLWVNSRGGSMWEGLPMHDLIAERKADVTGHIEGVAASIATVLLMACGKVTIAESAEFMIHEPYAAIEGNSNEVKCVSDRLEHLGQQVAQIYAQKTGKSADEMRALMKANGTGSQFFGRQAVAAGFCDEVRNNSQAYNLATEKFRAAGNGDNNKNQPQGNQPATPAAQPLPATAGMPVNQNNKPMSEPTNTPAVDMTAINSAIEAAVAKNELKNKLRALGTVPENELDSWLGVPNALDKAAKLAKPAAGAEPVNAAPSVVVTGTPYDRVKSLPLNERYAKRRDDWGAILTDAMNRDIKAGTPQNANTYSSTLVTDFLQDGFIVKLQNRWAPLKAFARDFRTDPMKPLATGQTRFVTTSGTVQTDATDFRTGAGVTVTPINVTNHQYTSPLVVSQSDLNNGFRMEQAVEISIAALANKLVGVVLANVTEANFATNGALTSAYDAFGFSDLAKAWGLIQKAHVKNLVLDGRYMARIVNQPSFFQVAGTASGNAWSAFGWDYVAHSSYWTGAGTNVAGIALDPQALVVMAGFPAEHATIPGASLQQGSVILPDVGLPVQTNVWFDVNARSFYASYDSVFGANLGDETAGVLFKTA